MMCTLSAFQLLPLHIVHLIVNHVAGSSRAYFDDVKYDGDDEYKVLQIPLLWVCHNFRDFVYRRFCKIYGLDLVSHSGGVLAIRESWPIRLMAIDHTTHHLAKDLSFHLNIWDVYSGKALQLLSATWLGGCAFPLVRMFSFDLYAGDKLGSTNKEYPPDTGANITSFVLRIKEMAPSVSVVHVNNYSEPIDLFKRQDANLMDLSRQLFGIAKTTAARICFESPFLNCMDLELVGNLVCLECNGDRIASTVLSLIQRNSQTLQDICLDVYETSDLTGLIHNREDGGYFVYPRLHTLYMSMERVELTSKQTIFNGAVPFPHLQKLILWMVYPFGDDVFFRGSATTLDYVSFLPSPELAGMLKRYKVLTPTSHPKLQYVLLSTFPYRKQQAIQSVDEYLWLALRIAPGASVRVMSDLSWPVQMIPSVLSAIGEYASIQVLFMQGLVLTIWDAVTLIKSLPLLSDLCTQAPTLGRLPLDAEDEDLHDYALRTYAPMGERFRCWEVLIAGDIDFKMLATCLLLLALICPNFDYAAVDKDKREQFMEAMRNKINEPKFRQHAPRLRRMLFDG